LTRNKLFLSLLIVILALTFFVSTVKADTVITDSDFSVSFLTGEALMYQDTTNNFNITFTISDGNLTGTASLNTDDTGGTLSITPTDSGVIAVTATDTNYTLSVNGNEMLGGSVNFVSGTTVIISWLYHTIILPNYPDVINVKPFWQYLFSGNLLGFFGSIFLSAFLLQDLLVGVICMLFLIPIYIKTKSLLLLSILWILLGGFFIVAMPSVSGLAVIFLILGIGSVLWKLVHPN
jgi:hypothetical protein